MKNLLSIIAFVCLISFSVKAQDSRVAVPSGYQGFLEYGTNYCPMEETTAIEFSTTHGCFFTDKAYIGMGIGLEGSDDWFLVPIFVTLKYNFTYNKPVTPTAQIRLGSYLGDEFGAYGDVAFGLRFGTKRDFACNLMLVCSLFQPMMEEYYSYDYVTGLDYYTQRNTYPSGFGIRFGIEW
ncbi:MAG: hypothetical protein KBT45_01625 [Bacteroidales bacterium]|nr:hypothetical protein [Candidatus Colimorpha pelethequi]